MLCWGNASFGQLGLGGIDEEIVLEPRKSDFFINKKVRDVGCGLRHTVFVLDDGTVYTCGCNDLGQLGHEKSRKKPGKLKNFLFALLIVILFDVSNNFAKLICFLSFKSKLGLKYILDSLHASKNLLCFFF